MCEHILWNKLRNRALGGYKFKRQFSIGPYIVDFYCAEAKLVIEIDGATHVTEKELKYDKLRQEFLEEQGLKVNRFLNSDIKDNLEEVLEDIYDTCKKRSIKSTSPQPSPVQERGRTRAFSASTRGGNSEKR
jgi:very-short-patch-repair endonuclease